MAWPPIRSTRRDSPSTRSSTGCARSSWGGERNMGAAAEIRVPVSRPIEEVTVDLGARSYPILVGSDLLGVVGPRLAAAGFRGRAAVITSERIGPLYAAPVLDSL